MEGNRLKMFVEQLEPEQAHNTLDSTEYTDAVLHTSFIRCVISYVTVYKYVRGCLHILVGV